MIDHSAKNMELYYFPRYRKNKKKLWLKKGKGGFQHNTKAYLPGENEKTAWTPTKLFRSQDDPYKAGFE